MKPRKLGILALLKYRGNPKNWNDAAAFAAEMAARKAGLAGWAGTGKAESFDGRTWTVDAERAPLVNGAARAGSLLLTSGCARCGEPLDAKGGNICTPCRKELDRKQDAMIEEAMMAEAA